MFNFSKFKNARQTAPTARGVDEFVEPNSRDAVATIESKGGVRRALLIGTGSWSAEGITALPGVERDVDLLRDVLLDPHCGFQDDNVDALTTSNNNYPTRERLGKTCAKFLRSCGPNDFVFLYLGGHGFHDPETDVDYYVPFDAKPRFQGGRVVSYDAATCFSFKELNELVGKCPARFKWVVVDACRVNLSAKDGLDENVRSIGKLEAAEGSLLFQSCGINQKSYEIPFVVGGQAVNHGLFTWHFCEGAKGKAADQNGLISPRGLFDYTRHKLAEARKEKALQKQTPIYSCQELSCDNFVFVDFSDRDAIKAKKAYDDACASLINGEYEKARVSIDEALEFEPENETYQDLKGSVEKLLEGERTKAIDAQIQELVAQGWEYFGQGKYSEALGAALEALKLAPKNPGALALKKQAENPIPTVAKNSSKNDSCESNASQNGTSAARLENGKTYYAASGRRAKAGRDAFAKTDYFLAKEEAENALNFNPSNRGAQDLLKKAQDELDKLARLIEEGNALFDSAKYEEALEKARKAKSLCRNYPDADALEAKVKAPLVHALVVDGWEAYSFDDAQGALAKAKQAFELNPNNEDVKELLMELGYAFFDQAEAGARKTLEYKGVEFSFRYCPSGTFTMGSPSSESGRDDDERQREVSISEGFWISETPTTQAQWNAVGGVKSNGCDFKGGKLPVENVTWYESDAFIKKLNSLGIAPEGWRFALPTEEQWEYACRAGTTGSTYGVPLADAAWYDDNSEDQTHEVGTKRPNNWGIYDMLGNVWEWTSSKNEGGSSFVFRGGGWYYEALSCRPANRRYYDPTNCYYDLGFRPVLVPSQSR